MPKKQVKSALSFEVDHYLWNGKMIEYHIFLSDINDYYVQKNKEGILEFFFPKTWNKHYQKAYIDWYFNHEYETIQKHDEENFWISEYLDYINLFTKRFEIKIKTGFKIRKYEQVLNCFYLYLPQDTYQDRKLLFQKIYWDYCYDYFKKRTDFWKAKMGLKFPVTVDLAWVKGYYGICYYPKRTIKYSYAMCSANKKVVDYLIIHELAHFVHHNHSSSFWLEVQKYCPDWKKYQAILRKNISLINATDLDFC